MSPIKPRGIYRLIRPLVFRMQPETAHQLTFKMMRLASQSGLTKIFNKSNKLQLPVTSMGLTFPNPIGLAAGLDKDGVAIDCLDALGFGFIELGTVTPKAQAGNEKPRLFRIPGDGALINRMGFNNQGVTAIIGKLRKRKTAKIIGVNIGKQMTTEIENAIHDYLFCMKSLFDFADYIAVNISSPNTPGLRELQKGSALEDLLRGLKSAHRELCEENGMRKPLLLKVAPDLSPDMVKHISDLVLKYQIDGLIATNTTIERNGMENNPLSAEDGGLSGSPLRERSTKIVRQFSEALDKQIPIIAAGGIMSGDDALEKIEAGAKLVQIYTGLIYRGPGLIDEIYHTLRISEYFQ